MELIIPRFIHGPCSVLHSLAKMDCLSRLSKTDQRSENVGKAENMFEKHIRFPSNEFGMLGQCGRVFYSRKSNPTEYNLEVTFSPSSSPPSYPFWKSTKLRSFLIQIISMIITGAFSGSTIGLWEFGTMMCSQCILVMLIQVIRDDP